MVFQKGGHPYLSLSKEHLAEFLRLYKHFNGNAKKAYQAMHPNASDTTATRNASSYMHKIDPYRIVLPAHNPNPKPMEQLEISKKTALEENQTVFEGLFQKYGGNGWEAAILAVQELYPHIKSRGSIRVKARRHLIKSNLILDNITALESKGVNAHKIADKILELLDAKRKVTVVKKKGEDVIIEEIDASAIDRGLTHALKTGVGGGYAPEKGLLGIKDFSLGKLLDEVEKESPANANG